MPRISKSTKEEEEHATMMAPAHAFMQAQAATRVVKRSKELQSKTNDNTILATLKKVEEMEMPIMISHPDEENVKVATVGMNFLSYPELYLVWPKQHVDAAYGIMKDLIISAMNGDSADKFEMKRSVFAARFAVAYIIEEAPQADGPLFEFIQDQSLRKDQAPFALSLSFHCAVLDGVDMPGLKGCMAIYRDKDGINTFTGLVRTPLPSPHWIKMNYDFGIAKLVDGNRDIEGPIRMITAEEFLAAMQEYDH